MAKDFYETLGVSRSASDKEIRSAYRRLARRYHPDVNPNDKAAEQQFKDVTAAFEVLSDPENRKKYDKYGDRWEYADQIEEMERQQRARGGRTFTGGDGATFHFETGGMDDLGDLGSIFGNIFGNDAGRGRARRARRGQNVDTPIEVSLEEAYHGTTRVLQLQSAEECPVCAGTGQVGTSVCVDCGGEGVRYRPRRLEVKVPRGVRTGSRVRIAGEGRPGIGGAPSGDLYLVVTVQPHQRFERKGDDLYVDVDVPVLDAILGGEVEVPTIEGKKVMLRVPEQTQNGAQIRLSGKGMPVLGATDRYGNLYARIHAKLPTKLSDEERELYERLRDTVRAHA